MIRALYSHGLSDYLMIRPSRAQHAIKIIALEAAYDASPPNKPLDFPAVADLRG